MTGRRHRVGDHQNRLTQIINICKNLQQIHSRLGIQGAGGLIGQHQFGLGDQGPSHRSPLFLPTGNLIGEFWQNIFDFQSLRKGLKPTVHFFIFFLSQHQR